MNFVRGLLLALLVAALTLFAVANSQMVPLNFGFIQIEIWLPLVVIIAFLVGFLPLWLRLVTDRMTARRKIRKLEEALAQSESALSQAKIELLRPAGAATVAPDVYASPRAPGSEI